MNEQTFPNLTKRQEEILSLIVRSYTENPETVSSKSLVEQYNLSISSATVRNEMAKLEELGYIAAPHTSAGRIPTALGYRYVVRNLLAENTLSLVDQHYIESRFRTLPAILEHWLRQAANVLARTANSASLVTPPVAPTRHFKHLELISIQGRLALMILVLQGGVVHQRMISLEEPATQDALSQIANHINELCGEASANQMRMKSHQLGELEREVVELAADLMDKSNSGQMRVIYQDGLSEIIDTFTEHEGVQQAVRVFEERAFVDVLLSELLPPVVQQDDVQVIIAGDGHEEMSHLSLVLSRYGVPGQLRGMLGVLGPTNLNYGKAISTVRTVSGLMTNMLVELYEEQSTDEDAPAPPEEVEK